MQLTIMVRIIGEKNAQKASEILDRFFQSPKWNGLVDIFEEFFETEEGKRALKEFQD